MDTPTITSPVEGSESMIDSTQAAQIPEGSESQIATTPSQVEGGQSTSQGNSVSAPDFETARQIKNLVKEFRALKQSFNTRPSESASQSPQPQAQPQKFTREDWERDFNGTMQKLVEQNTAKSREDILNTIQQRESTRSFENAWQEGLRLINTNELSKNDPNYVERMKDIFYEEDADGNSLDQYSKSNPKHAAQLALKEYKSKFSQRQSGVTPPSKAQMATTATAQTTGTNRTTTAAQIQTLMAQLTSNPDLMKDNQFMSKMNEAIKRGDLESKGSK